MNVFDKGVIILCALFFIQCTSQQTPTRLLKKCQTSLLNQSKIASNLRTFSGAIRSASVEYRDAHLEDSISINLVSKFHQKSHNIGLIPKFINIIDALSGILLHSAVSEKRLDVFQSLIYLGAEVDTPNRFGLTPLYKAIESRQNEMIATLIKCGADPNFPFQNSSLLHKVVSVGNLYGLQTLIELGAKIDSEDYDGKTPLYYALISDQKEIVKKLLQAGANVNIRSISGKTLLHKAVFENRHNTVRELLKLGAKIDVTDNDGITPLYVSLMSNNSEITELLIANGANKNFVSDNGNSLLHTAVSSKRKDVVDLLLHLGSDQMTVDIEGLTPLYRAIKEDNLEIIESLIKDPDVLNKKPPKCQDYPIHFAVSNGSYSTVKLLLEKGANRYLRNNEDFFPLGLAIARNKTDIVDLLLSEEPKITRRESVLKELSTSLHMAVKNGNILGVKRLLEFGVLLNESNVEGNLVIAAAVERNDIPMVNLLIVNGANVSVKNIQGDSLLHIAVSKEAFDAVKLLVDLGLDVETTNNRGLTPLFLATLGDNSTIIRYLVSKGANVNRKLKNGDKPLFIAILNGTFTTVTTLIELGADIDNDRSVSAVEKAVEADRPDVIKLLVSKGVPLRNRRTSLLHMAAEYGKPNAIRTLLNLGIPVDSKYSGYTPLWSATKKDRPQAIEVLLNYGADINETAPPPFFIRGTMNASWSLLHEAVYKNLVNSTLVLLQHGINPNSRDFRSWTPLHYAAIMGNAEIAEILIRNGADIFAKTNNGLTALGIVSYSQELSKQGIINLLKSYGEHHYKLS